MSDKYAEYGFLIFYPESIDQFSFVLNMFHFTQTNHPTKKTIHG
ncbi:hypothetical protein VRK_36720 [Vibrio sp. MEBiC08052]|nr:hypothetical protein VRK_36720 [Vibrio sp. MEBiC08052]